MKNIFWKELTKRYFIFGAFGTALIILSIAALVAYLHFTAASGNTIIIHLDFYRDRSVVGDMGDLYRFIFVGLVLISINFFIAKELILKNAYLSRIVAGGSLILAILILIAVGSIIGIN